MATRTTSSLTSLPSATKLRRLCFYRRLSVHRGVSASVHGGIHPLGADTPWSRHPQGQMPPGSRCPPGADTPQSRQFPLEQTPPRSRHPPRKTATAADVTHPTGMHSCFNKNSRLPCFLSLRTHSFTIVSIILQSIPYSCKRTEYQSRLPFLNTRLAHGLCQYFATGYGYISVYVVHNRVLIIHNKTVYKLLFHHSCSSRNLYRDWVLMSSSHFLVTFHLKTKK